MTSSSNPSGSVSNPSASDGANHDTNMHVCHDEKQQEQQQQQDHFYRKANLTNMSNQKIFNVIFLHHIKRLIFWIL